MQKYNQKQCRKQVFIPKIKKHVSEKTAEHIEDCSNQIEFVASDGEKKRKMVGGITCKNRFCPQCAWRHAKKDAMVLSTLMKFIASEKEKTFIFLTLTVVNVPGEDLKSEIKKINVAFQKLFHRKEISEISFGYMRKLEITYSHERHDFHPHIHAVVAVNKSYGKNIGHYVTQPVWLQLWRDCIGDQAINQVHVQKMDMVKGVNEIAKYTAKDSDYLHSDEVFDVFYLALRGAQVLTFNGLFKLAKSLYDNDKLEAYKQIDKTNYIFKIVSQWFHISTPDADGVVKINEYQDTDKRLLTEDELVKYNGQAMGESEEFRDD